MSEIVEENTRPRQEDEEKDIAESVEEKEEDDAQGVEVKDGGKVEDSEEEEDREKEEDSEEEKDGEKEEDYEEEKDEEKGEVSDNSEEEKDGKKDEDIAESVKEKDGEKEEGSEDSEEDEKDEVGRVDEEDDVDDEDEDEVDRGHSEKKLYDFDIMMAKKKEESSRKRKRKNYDIINDNDDIIADIINQMRDAVELDREANKNKQAATKKLKMLPFVVSQLRKVDLRDAFLDSDILSAIAEWLSILPDKSLPHLNIRESLLKVLDDFNLYDVDRIRASGIGKAVMYLYKHPKETKENKARAKKLISHWSRPIFQLDTSFDSITREEREQRDLKLMNKRATKKASTSKAPETAAQKPGDKGWIPRARVPAPSMKDYVIRPESKVTGEAFRSRPRPSIIFKNKLPRRRYV